MIKRLLISFLLLITATLHSGAVPRYQVSYYIKERGLPRTLVQDMIQDSNGCLWLASWSGLYRFDGISFSGFRVKTPNGERADTMMRARSVFCSFSIVLSFPGIYPMFLRQK